MKIFLMVLGMLFCYLLGTFPSAYIITKIISGKDIRKVGSGNVGATNTLRVIGKIPGLMVLLLDVLKGVLAVTIIANIFYGKLDVSIEIVRALFGLSSVLGHIFNVFLGFKGGKGVATSAGVILLIAPKALVIALLIFVIIVFMTKYVSLGSILSSVFIPFFLVFSKAHYSYILLSSILCIIIVIKHKANINRLLNGREGKVFERK